VLQADSCLSLKLFSLASFALALGCGGGGTVSGIDSGPRDTESGLGLDGSADFGTVAIDGRGGVDVEARSEGNIDAATDTADGRPFDVVREAGKEPDVALDAAKDGTDVAGASSVDAAMLDASADVTDGAPFLTIDGSGDSASGDARSILGDTLDAGDARGIDGGLDSGTANSVVPSLENGIFTFAAGNVSFAVDSTVGARITTYALDGTNVVTTPDSHPSNYGSTFWPSPQSAWNWPPPVEIDSAPYVGTFADGALTLVSGASASLGLAVSKQFSMDADTGDVVVRYSLINKSKSAQSFAPWEITRVAPSGIMFFPIGASGPRKGSQDLLNVSILSGVAWFAYDANVITNDQKLFADGAEGWIAHVDGGSLFIKSFADISLAQAAPSEAEIELFANAAHTYVELENQGAYAPIPAGGTSTWSVRWFVRALPASIPVSVGSTALVDYVRSIIAGS
jgi:hypothetical protein